MSNTDTTYHAPTGIRIGHIHLKVSDLERSIAFYRDVMGFDLLFHIDKGAFLSVGGYHHHIGLNTWFSEGVEPLHRKAKSTGMYHFALNYPTRKDLALALKRLHEKNYPITGSSDHYTHIAIYLADPDGHGIELAWDRDPSYWTFMTDGNVTPERLQQGSKPLDLTELLQEAE
ncbi:MAG TPA: VOC family protein [Flavisolibacter sp.]|nr:VOC family protein [Flavisolibacter sp.]